MALTALVVPQARYGGTGTSDRAGLVREEVLDVVGVPAFRVWGEAEIDRNIGQDEPRLALDSDYADGVGVEVEVDAA